MWVDSHCHLSDTKLLPDLPLLKQRMFDHQVDTALVIGTTLEDCEIVLSIVDNNNNNNNNINNNNIIFNNISNNQPKLYASLGVHPEDRNSTEPTIDSLLKLVNAPNTANKVLAIGETGLDYHWFKDEILDSYSNLDWQRQRFITHIHAALSCHKPLVVHTRDAASDTIQLLTAENARDCGGVIHCFTETWAVAKAALDLGFYISFSGIITFKNADDLREVARKVPADRILVETDSPYLAPIPKRGKTNEPAFVSHVGEFLAQWRGVDSIDFAASTSHNFWQLFNQNN